MIGEVRDVTRKKDLMRRLGSSILVVGFIKKDKS
jgi:hypothetical protein